MLADEPRQRFLEQIDLAFVDEQLRAFAAKLGGNRIQSGADNVQPALRIRFLEGFQRAAVFDGWYGFESRAEFRVLSPDRLRRHFTVDRGCSRRLPQIV